ncbi:MAG: branched-chain amino acid ABC transporter permease, partial [Roseiflexaceae bacterium]|nr:branched-chain amino acid ABC transporter permease [Roseiflexaceae bacterium]
MAAGAFQVIINYVQFPNGGSGMLGRTDGGGTTMARPLLAQSDVAYFRYVVVVVAFGFLLVEWHRRTRPGRAWALLSKSEACALSAGVNITLYKTWAFTLAGFLAGVAGGLLAGSIGQLDARTFPAGDSIMLFALTVVGGAYSWFGPILTGLLLRAVPALLTYLGLNADLALILFGAALLHALITAPTGIAGQIEGLLHRIRRRGDAP